MCRRKTTEEFIKEALKIHGNKYNYSYAKYVNASTPIEITCPIHGNFWQRAADHLNGHGCPFCSSNKHRGKNMKNVYNSLYRVKRERSYIVWSNMLLRTIDNPVKEKLHTYKDCEICEEWKNYENFKKWYDDPTNGYIKGYDLDKDLLSKEKKIYSPETCCFIPKYINSILRHKPKNDSLPSGVCKNGNGYRSRFMCKGKVYCKQHNTIEEAETEYKHIKSTIIREEAEKLYSSHLITEKVYKALVKYCLEHLV